MKFKINKNTKKVAAVSAVFFALSFFGFNCAPDTFQLAEQSSLSLTNGVISPTVFGTDFNDKPVLPEALLTSEQILNSMLNVTGQTQTVTNAQLNEYRTRAGLLSESSEVSLVNGPMLIAVTSLAGEICNGVVGTEANMAMANRKLTAVVDYNMPVTQLTDVSYGQVVNNFTTKYWGRAPSSEESTFFTTFRNEFIAAIPTANIAQAAQTRALILSTCTAMLSAFETYTY